MLNDVLLRKSKTLPEHVKEVGFNQKTKQYRIVLEESSAYFFLVLDNIVASFQLPKPKTAPFEVDKDIHYYGHLHRASFYLEVKYAMNASIENMYLAARKLPQRDTVMAVYRDFKAASWPRKVVVEAIVEHCLALVFELGWNENKAWNSVMISRFDGITELEDEVNTWWRRMMMIRRAKRALLGPQIASRQGPVKQGSHAPKDNTLTPSNKKIDAQAEGWDKISMSEVVAKTGGLKLQEGAGNALDVAGRDVPGADFV